MQALNLRTEYRREYPALVKPVTDEALESWAKNRVASGAWVEDDGDYYLPEVWATQHDEGDNYTGPTYPEYDYED